jgi:hypothetical protein
VALGEATTAAYHQAAGARPGTGAQVSLDADPGVVGESYNVPASTPALRPSVRPAPVPQYADLAVGGIGSYHGVTPGQASGALEGVPVPSVRGDSLVYIPVSSSSPVSAPRPSLGSRLRGAWRALRGR